MILRNAIITPDGTELVSRSVHDFQRHIDGITRKTYIVDGGCEYIKRGGDYFKDEESWPENYCVESTDSHEIKRERLDWGSRGKSGTDPLKYIKIEDLEDDHLMAIVIDFMDEKLSSNSIYFQIMLDEVDYRINKLTEKK